VHIDVGQRWLNGLAFQQKSTVNALSLVGGFEKYPCHTSKNEEPRTVAGLGAARSIAPITSRALGAHAVLKRQLAPGCAPAPVRSE
jgi:hypothetical protein